MKAILIFLLLTTAITTAAPLPDDFLAARGTRIENQLGQAVALRGVNLGGWLLFEPWMCPMDSSGMKDDYTARETLIKRFGTATADGLAVYQDNWFTEADLDRIAAQGLNVIRLPFWYRNLMDEQGNWKRTRSTASTGWSPRPGNAGFTPCWICMAPPAGRPRA